MAVITDFIGVPLTGLIPPSQAIQFTDLSTGGPDSWLWSFGDGSFSSDQHPLHTFTGVALDTFTVSLTSWIADTPTTVSNASETRQSKGPSTPASPVAQAYSDYMALSYGLNTPNVGSYMAIMNGTPPTESFTFLGTRVKHTTSFSALGTTDVAIVLEARTLTTDAVLNRTISVFTGVMNYTFNGGLVATLAAAPLSSWGVIYDATVWAGVAGVLREETPVIEPLISPAQGTLQNGIITEHRMRLLKSTAADTKDTETKIAYVMFGAPPVAAFTADPVKGPGVLSVQFENLSTEAIGIATTYSWKRRISGSGDSFVEFSTDENPLELFSK